MCEKMDCDKVQVHRGRDGRLRNAWRSAVVGVAGLFGASAVTFGNRIYLSKAVAHNDQILVHEVAHAGQRQEWGALRYYGRGFGTQARGPFKDVYDPGDLAQGRPFGSYGMEQQATIVERCYLQNPAACAISPYSFPR